GIKAATSGRGSRGQGTGDRGQKEQVERFLASHNISPDTPLNEIRPAVLDKVFRGDGNDFLGLVTLLEQEFVTATDLARQEQLEMFRGHVVCVACRGARLRPEALSVRIGGKNIADMCCLSIADAAALFDKLHTVVI